MLAVMVNPPMPLYYGEAKRAERTMISSEISKYNYFIDKRLSNMVYVSVNDFYEKAGSFPVLTRQEEIECAEQMKNGDTAARERLIQSYIPMVAGHMKHMKPHLQTLGLVLYCLQALEKAVDTFNFLQDSEPFSHRLSWHLRQAAANYIVR